MLPVDVKFPVLSHRHSRNTPRHKLPVCGRQSQVVAPRWRVGMIPIEFYPSYSYPLNSCVTSPISVQSSRPAKAVSGNVYYDCVVYVVPCNCLYQYLKMFRRCHGNDATVRALFFVTRVWHLLQRNQVHAQQTVSRHDQQKQISASIIRSCFAAWLLHHS